MGGRLALFVGCGGERAFMSQMLVTIELGIARLRASSLEKHLRAGGFFRGKPVPSL